MLNNEAILFAIMKDMEDEIIWKTGKEGILQRLKV